MRLTLTLTCECTTLWFHFMKMQNIAWFQAEVLAGVWIEILPQDFPLNNNPTATLNEERQDQWSAPSPSSIIPRNSQTSVSWPVDFSPSGSLIINFRVYFSTLCFRWPCFDVCLQSIYHCKMKTNEDFGPSAWIPLKNCAQWATIVHKP